MNVETHIDDAATMLKKRGLEANGRVQRIFTLLCVKEMDAYVPMQQGVLKNTRVIGADSVTYNTPYSRNMYYGKVMVDPVTKAAGFMTSQGWRSRKGVRKVVSTREYQYHGAPKRGKLWDKRMWAEKKYKVVKDTATAAGGKPG